MAKGMLFVVSGPSGTGKGTICSELLKIRDVEISVSMTTRQPRPGEQNGINYHFVSREQFLDMIEEDGFLEYAEVYGNYYGTPKDLVFKTLNAGKDVVLEIDIQGALKVKEKYEKYEKGIFIFILPPSMMELRKRITARGSETPEAINLRLGETLREVSYIDKYDYCVINNDLAEATNQVASIITAAHCRVTEDIYKLIRRYEEEI